MRRSHVLYLAVLVLVAPHMTAGSANVLGGLLLLAAAVLRWLGD
jgi:hypothetical protein